MIAARACAVTVACALVLFLGLRPPQTYAQTAPRSPEVVTLETLGPASLAGVPTRVSTVEPPNVSAREVAVLDAGSGVLLYGIDPYAAVAPASTTKIVTASVVLERAEDLDARVVVTVDGWGMAARDGSSVMGLVPGTRVSLRTLLYGLMLPSGNDAAEQLALAIGGDRATFVEWMNEYVASRGLVDTHFANPSGFDEEGHLASAYDLAWLANEAMHVPTFAEIVGTPVYTADGFELVNRNPLLPTYTGADGVKTGTSTAAGRALVASASRNGRRLLVTVIHSERVEQDSAVLLDWAWEAFRWPTP